MEKKGMVSLWIGDIESDEALEDYLEVGYNEDGTLKVPRFLRDYDIELDDYDEDFVERIYLEETVDELKKLIKGCSYEEMVEPLFSDMIGLNSIQEINAAILLYNFEYIGDIKFIEGEGRKFNFIGTVKYE